METKWAVANTPAIYFMYKRNDPVYMRFSSEASIRIPMNEHQYFMVHVTDSRVFVDDLLVSTTETLSALMFHLLVLMCPAPNFAGGFSTSCAARLMLILPVEATFNGV